MVEKFLFKSFNKYPEESKDAIIQYFSEERTRDEALAFFGYGRARRVIPELIDDHTLKQRDERFVDMDGNVQITPKYRIHKELQRNKDNERPHISHVPPVRTEAATETEARILDTIGTFREGAPIQTGDIRFASKCDGLDLSDMDPAALTRVLKRRCEPRIDREVHRTYWYRTW